MSFYEATFPLGAFVAVMRDRGGYFRPRIEVAFEFAKPETNPIPPRTAPARSLPRGTPPRYTFRGRATEKRAIRPGMGGGTGERATLVETTMNEELRSNGLSVAKVSASAPQTHIVRMLPTPGAPGDPVARALCGRWMYARTFVSSGDNLDGCSCLACARVLNEKTLAGEIVAGRVKP